MEILHHFLITRTRVADYILKTEDSVMLIFDTVALPSANSPQGYHHYELGFWQTTETKAETDYTTT